MKKRKMVVEMYECYRCKHLWVPDKKKTRTGKYTRKDNLPKKCPKCHSPYWDKLPDPRYSKVAEIQKKRKR